MNTVTRHQSVGIQTRLPCQHEIKDAKTDVIEELVQHVENLIPDDTFDPAKGFCREANKSEFETEYQTEYEPDCSFQFV